MSEFWSNELVNDYLDDRLSPEERMRVDKHLRANPEDRGLLEQYQEMQQALRESRRYELDDEFSTRVLQTIEMSAREVDPGEAPGLRQVSLPAKKSSTLQWRYTASMIASLAAILLVAFFLLPRPQITDGLAEIQFSDPLEELQLESAAPPSMEGANFDSDKESATGSDEIGKQDDIILENRAPTPRTSSRVAENADLKNTATPPSAVADSVQLAKDAEDLTGAMPGGMQTQAAEEDQQKPMDLAGEFSELSAAADPSVASAPASKVVLVTLSETNRNLLSRLESQYSKALSFETGEAPQRLAKRMTEKQIAGRRGAGNEPGAAVRSSAGGGGMADASGSPAGALINAQEFQPLAFEIDATPEQLQKILTLIQAERVTLTQSNQDLWMRTAAQEETNLPTERSFGAMQPSAPSAADEKKLMSLSGMPGVSIRRRSLQNPTPPWQEEAEELGSGSGLGFSRKKQNAGQASGAGRNAEAKLDDRDRRDGEASTPQTQRFLLIIQLTAADAAKPMTDNDSPQAPLSGKSSSSENSKKQNN